MTNAVMQAVSLASSALLLGAYFRLLQGRWAPLSWRYLSINGLAGIGFLAVGLYDWRFGGITTNAVFLAINAWAMWRKVSS
jgi:hypothetical protein